MRSSRFRAEAAKFLKHRNPWLAALLNFFFWGLGFIYTGRRLFLGVSLFFFTIMMFTAASLASYDIYRAVALVLAAWLFISLALAREAYLEARERNRKVENVGKGED